MGRPSRVTFSAPIHHHRIKRKLPDNIHFSKAFHPLFCRQHRQPDCCPHATGPGLAEAIPAFLKTSANMLRSVLEHNQDMKPLKVAGQSVMGGGMPPRWYDLFLDLLTQAAIQCYMCDGQTGLETISEIFSYGYVEDEEEIDYEDEEDEEEEEVNDDLWTVKAADHHLLFPKTRTMYLFKLQVHQREKQVKKEKKFFLLFSVFTEIFRSLSKSGKVIHWKIILWHWKNFTHSFRLKKICVTLFKCY